MEILFRYKCYEVDYAELGFQKKVTLLKKYLLLKFIFWKSSSSKELPVSKKYTF